MPKFFTPSKIFLFMMIAFVVGIFLANFVTFSQEIFYILVAMDVLLIITALIWNKYFPVKFLAILSFVLILGVTYYGLFQNKVVPQNLPYNKDITFTSVVFEEPQTGDKNCKLTLKIVSVENNSEKNNLIGERILVTVPRYPEYRYGDELKISGKLEKPEKIQDFDYGEYLSRYLIFAIIIHPTNVQYIASGHGDWLHNILFAAKNKFQSTINQILPEPLSALLSGLLLGSRQGFPDNLMNAFNIVGITHIIAISGYNITIIVKTFERFSKSWSRNLAFFSGIIGILLFTILTGASASVVRAAVISSLFLFASMLGRRGTISVAVVFVAFLMILQNPFILRFDIGFQLSFLAVLGLIFISPIFEKLFGRFAEIFREPLAATLGAQLATIPIIIMNFSRISIIAPLANTLILPVVPTTMGVGFIAAVVGMISLSIGKIVAWIAWILLKYIIIVAELLARVPYASLDLKFDKWPIIMLIYIIIYIFVRIMYKKLKLTKSELNNY